MSINQKLIVFARNLMAGEVKTRISNRTGTSKALSVYEYLFRQTLSTVSELPAGIQTLLYFSDHYEEGFDRVRFNFLQKIQQGNGLGERMTNAFKDEFSSGSGKICLIGTDIYKLNPVILIKAFEDLDNYDIVLGPALDGGYYLIGMKVLYPELFIGIDWGTGLVLNDTIKGAESQGLRYSLLPVLKDIDEFEDIPQEIIDKLGLD